jgi:hydroxymethylpyrimidine pyrophosphatase-like HAD family hydrolase
LTLHGIKLLVLDVDGTVLTRDHRILPAVKGAVDRAWTSGLTLALATARSPRGLRPIAWDLGILEHCICFNGANFLEITALGVDKAKAVEALASHLGASLAQVAAIGDSDNDRAMIEAVGIGIAMGNASAELRSRAAWVTGTNQEAGVARAIERLIERPSCGVREPMPCR